jgi:hypothetical protein
MCKKYRPSNSDEGMWFESKFCQRCIHEKYLHTQQKGDAQCEIFNKAFWEGYVDEWIYDENDNPICTAWVTWDWRKDDDDENGGWNDPPPPLPDNPNQLVLPFAFEELENQTFQLGIAIKQEE